MKYFLALVCLVVLAGCTKETESMRVLQAAGYKDIILTGYSWFGCGKEDSFHTGFTATGANGAKVEGVVCAGAFKGNTIRID